MKHANILVDGWMEPREKDISKTCRNFSRSLNGWMGPKKKKE